MSAFSDYLGEIEKIWRRLKNKWLDHSMKFVDSYFKYYCEFEHDDCSKDSPIIETLIRVFHL